MFDYTELENTAESLIENFGRTMELARRTQTPPDISKPWEPDVEDSAGKTSVIAVAVPYTIEERSNSVIEQGDQRFYIKGKGITPPITTDDTLLDGAINWQIVNVSIVGPGDTILFYDIQARL